MNPYGNKGWLDDYERDDYHRTKLYHEYMMTNWYDETFNDWYKWKLKRVKAENKRKTIQLRRTVLLHKILNNGYMVVNYVR